MVIDIKILKGFTLIAIIKKNPDPAETGSGLMGFVN